MSTVQASEKGKAWFKDAGFGMFVHWGLYALVGKGEWNMFLDRVSIEDYEPLAHRFNPTEFDAEAWVDLAERAGQKYITFTTRHHDGFSMYDTALSDYKAANSPFGRDPLSELAEAAQRRGIKLGMYVSLLDWHHPAFRFRAESGMAWDDYVGFLHGQVEELCTQYGDVAEVWFDGDWPRSPWTVEHAEWMAPGGSFEYPRLYEMIHRLQPDAVVLNNRKDTPLPAGEDVQGFENDLPGENTAGFNTSTVLEGLRETCLTMNRTWGWVPSDNDYKSVDELVGFLQRARAAECNLLLNVGPTPLGTIPEPQAERLRGIGASTGAGSPDARV